MKILMFTPYVPYPPHSGGQTRTFNLIKNLSAKHKITSMCFLRVDQPEPDLSELKKYCSAIKIFPRKRAWASVSKIFLTGISAYPYLAVMYYYDSVKKAIAKELASGKYDLIHVETYYIMPNIPNTKIPVILAEQTIEYSVYQHYVETTKYWFTKPLLYLDVIKHKYWEQYYWKRAKKVLAMSQNDREKMLDLVPALEVDLCPNGVDLEAFSQRIETPAKTGKRFLFVGNFNWLQNREAVDILIAQIWPKIKEQLPDSQLWIVGKNPPESIKKLATADVLISGDIEDIRVAYQGSDVLLAPLFGSGGTRYKILEAMASNLPVVATEIGIEGIGAVNNVHALINNDMTQLAKLSVEAATDKKLADKISKNAHDLIAANYDWKIISAKLDKIYEETAGKN